MYASPFDMIRPPMATSPGRTATHPNADAFPSGLSGPALRALARAGIRSLAQLAAHRKSDMAALHGMGPKGIRVLESALALTGRRFLTDETTPRSR